MIKMHKNAYSSKSQGGERELQIHSPTYSPRHEEKKNRNLIKYSGSERGEREYKYSAPCESPRHLNNITGPSIVIFRFREGRTRGAILILPCVFSPTTNWQKIKQRKQEKQWGENHHTNHHSPSCVKPKHACIVIRPYCNGNDDVSKNVALE